MIKLIESDRLLAEVELEPVQGSRFQPTGFPSLGSAEFSVITDNNQSVKSLLVESSQSMANRLEAVCWNEKESRLVDVLGGMPLIIVNNKDGKFLTNSLLEAHRLNSSYMLEGDDKKLNEKLKEELPGVKDDNEPIKISELARFALKYDPNSVLHGLFLSRKEIAGGRYKMTRSLSSFIEAYDVEQVVSGGVKLDRVDPTGADGGAETGFGHIPYPRTEYSAKTIKAYFNIDLSLIRSYSLSDTANEFLFVLALWKIQSFLKRGLRLRTACDLKVKGNLRVIEPESFTIPSIEELEENLGKIIKKCNDESLFNPEPLVIQYKKSKGKKSKDDAG